MGKIGSGLTRSRRYLDGAKGQMCTVRIPGVCNRDRDTVISAHIRDGSTGMGVKASDLSTVSCCSSCHDAIDGRSIVLSREDWLFYALRGLQETLQQRFDAGLLIVPVDIENVLADRTVKSRKPKDQRAKIPSRKFGT